MFREERSMVIDRPLHDVFEYLADFGNDRHWRGELIDVWLVEGRPKTVGAKYRQRVQWEGREVETEFEVDSFDTDQCIGFHGESAGVQAKANYRFQPLGEDRTRLHIMAEIQTQGAMKVMEPFIWGLLRRQGEQDLHSLKEVLERRLVHAG